MPWRSRSAVASARQQQLRRARNSRRPIMITSLVEVRSLPEVRMTRLSQTSRPCEWGDARTWRKIFQPHRARRRGPGERQFPPICASPAPGSHLIFHHGSESKRWQRFGIVKVLLVLMGLGMCPPGWNNVLKYRLQHPIRRDLGLVCDLHDRFIVTDRTVDPLE